MKATFSVNVNKVTPYLRDLDNYTILIFDEIKQEFFQAVTMWVLLYGCTVGTLIKYLGKKLDGNNSMMLHAVSKKSWKQHLTKQQLYGRLFLISQTV